MPTRRRKDELSSELVAFKVTKIELDLIEKRARDLRVNRSEAIRSAVIGHLAYLEALKNGEKNATV